MRAKWLGIRKELRSLLWAAVIAGIFTALAAAGFGRKTDLAAADALYQSRSLRGEEIVLIGIDQRAMEEIGPYSQWERDIIAMTLETLNESEECHPAVIALDILYAGETDEDLDAWLAEVAGRYGNVVTAGAAQFGNRLVEDGDDYRLNTFSVLGFEGSYEALREGTVQSHINVMLDDDGILRHHLLRITLEDGTVVPSLALAATQLYQSAKGGGETALPPVSEGGFWYLPFCGAPGDFDESISLVDVITGAAPADYFDGKIVLIGPYAQAFQDDYFTSISHARTMYGVEIHANAIQALLRGEYKKEAGKAGQLILLFVICVGAFLGFRYRKVYVAVLLWAALCGGWLLLCRLLYEKGIILHVLWVPAAVCVLFVGCIAYNYIRAALEKQRITGTFQRYVDPSVIRELLKEGSDSLELGGKLTEIAVLFVDIRGFTTMSEMLTAPQVVEILNEYLTLTTKCIMEQHGMLDKFVGDCTMAVWNAPLEQEDYIMLACRAAMAMVEGSKPLAEKLQKQFGRTVSFGVGVNAGPAVVGNIGAPMRMDYTAIGDTVNTAARLEANAPAGCVYISRVVADALGDRIRTTSLGDSVKLKGKKDGFEVLRLEAIAE